VPQHQNTKKGKTMAIITQQTLFSWKEIDSTSDLDRLKLVLEYLPDEELMVYLEEKRGKGRNDYTIRSIWNTILAGIVYQHKSIESLRRELLRNPSLCYLCGIDPFLGINGVPSSSAYTHFLKNLIECEDFIEKMINTMIKKLKDVIPDLGRYLAVDSKAISSFGRKCRKLTPDGRRNIDADHGSKRYYGIDKKGRLWERIKTWFGYKLHLIVDSKYELPLAGILTKASVSDTNLLLPLVEKLKGNHPEIIERAEYLAGDKGYDSTENNRELFDKYKIKPIIDIRKTWRDDNDKLRSLDGNHKETILMDDSGKIFCDIGNEEKFKHIAMSYCGFEKSRMTLKYICPAHRAGTYCNQAENGTCQYGKIVRIKIENDRRRFTPVPRHTHKWKREYKKRNAVERVNSRIAQGYCFENHFIRGMKKMEVRINLALLIMLVLAYGSIKTKQPERIRSLTWSSKFG